MPNVVRTLARASAFVLLAFAAARSAAGQGVTGAAVEGAVTAAGGGPIEGATVLITSQATGQRYQVATRSNGRFNVENVSVGGQFVIEARAIGFEPARKDGIVLTLGQRFTADFELTPAAVQLQEVTVRAEASPLINSARTGAAQTLVGSQITSLPLQGRTFTDLAITSPQVTPSASATGAFSIAGQNNRYNNIQIDGGVNNDLFGLGSTGAPGGQVNSKPISLEAVQEFQILIAPFDVREGNFSGGLLNAITKSGTNHFEGSTFGYFRNQGITGADPQGNPSTDFKTWQYGATFSGPIVRDKVHFFFATDVQSSSAPFVGQQIGPDPTNGQDSLGIGITQATATRVQQIAQQVYGFDPGDWRQTVLGNPDRNIFGKVTAQLATNSRLELTYNNVHASRDQLTRNATSAVTQDRDGYQLSNSGWTQASNTNTARLKWLGLFGNGLNNELLLGYQRIRDSRDQAFDLPLFKVQGDRAGSYVAAGSDVFTPNNLLNQDIWELTDNLTFEMGSHHRITVGTHNEFFKFFNNFFPRAEGVWTFADTTAFANNTPNRYTVAIPLRPSGPAAGFNVRQVGGYLQDAWSPNERLTVTLGLRADVPFTDSPQQNPKLLASPLNINTAAFPSANVLWSPRLGFNYDLDGRGRTIVRGGVGIFSGRPPYVWLSNAFGNTGLEQATLTCTGAATPPATTDINALPQQCVGSTTGPVQAPPSIVYFEPGFRYPQNLRAALGADHRFPLGIVGTVDFLYTYTLNDLYQLERNAAPGATATAEAGRQLYGGLGGTATTFTASPGRVDPAFASVLDHYGRSGPYSWSITGQLQKTFSKLLDFNASYTYAVAKDYFSFTSSIASSNYQFASLDGPAGARNLRTSYFSVPHKIALSGTVHLPLFTSVSLIYVGRSGQPFNYVVSSDVNADGFAGNDDIYIPRDQSDISLAGTPAAQQTAWTRLDSLITSNSCLQSQRGQIMQRTSCRNPWQNVLNTRVSVNVPFIGGQALEVDWDIFNVLHLLSGDWGIIKSTTTFENATLLRASGYDAVNQRPIYSLAFPQFNLPDQNASRWRMQLGAKWVFSY